MALASTSQTDWSGGMYRGRSAPATAAYDILNGLINDEGHVIRRGGSAFFTASTAVTLTGVTDMYLGGGQRTVAWGDGTDAYVRDESTFSWVSAFSTGVVPISRVAPFGSIAVFRVETARELVLYGGSLKSASLSTSGTTTNGSPTVTGAATTWLATVDPGMLLLSPSGDVGVVASVDSNTQLTLRDPWPGSTATGSFTLAVAAFVSAPDLAVAASVTDTIAASVGSPARLVWCFGNRAYFTDRGRAIFSVDQYHELPASAVIVGADSISDTLVLFTTNGVWAVSNMAFDPVDAFGNVQHQVSEISKNLIAWGDPGITGYEGAFVVPTVDDVVLFSLGAPPVSLTGDASNHKIRDMYRAYVKAGYQPGVATVHRAHYILPILNGTTLVDVLVCRLDRGFVWTRWSGHAAGLSYAQRVGSTTRRPKLLGISSLWVTDLSGCFDPTSGNATDADGTAHTLDVISRDFPTGANQHGFVQRVRARYELTDGGTPDPAVAVAFSSDADAGVFTTLTETGGQGGTTGWGASDGSSYSWAIVGRRRERIRFRIRVTGAAASFVLRSLELLLRPTGRQ